MISKIMVPKVKRSFFRKYLLIKLLSDNTEPIYIISNDLNKIIDYTLGAATKKLPYSVYLKENINFSGKLKITGKNDYSYFKERFEKHCIEDLPYDNGTKILKNLSLNKTEEFADYPLSLKMIMIVENFNFYDKKSQYFLSKLSENKNILLIGQLRDDFDFAENHLDISVRARGSKFKI